MKKWLACVVMLTGCAPSEQLTPLPPTLKSRTPCVQNISTRQALFGDLHVHTAFSFDARSYHIVLSPDDAYRFARGEAVSLPPLDNDGQGTRTTRLNRPLDFAAVTDHAEFLGEIYQCSTPEAERYDSPSCETYRSEVGGGAFDFGLKLSQPDPIRSADLCGEDGSGCRAGAKERWGLMQTAAEKHYDRSETCTFSSFVAYEYTNTLGVSNLHRNVVFKNEIVPEMPISYFEAPTPLKLWQDLKNNCRDDDGPCDVLVLPHNSNLSNGNLFDPQYPGGADLQEEAEHAQLRIAMEPVVEMFQHKGDSECRNGFPEINGDPDPLCDFEKLRPPDSELCGEETGQGGMRLWGCVHRHDFVRNVLKTGLLEEQRLGVNPYALGMIGSTDTHNATPGKVDSVGFPGHVGLADDTAEKRLGLGGITHDGVINNPGGLAAVWAEENSRDSIFDAIMRRETFATSGPRIKVRLFGGWSYDSELCASADMLQTAYDQGVPMGGVLGTPSGSAPVFLLQAEYDAGTIEQPGVLLQRVQIIKGYVDEGKVYEKIYEVAGDANNEASVNVDSCEVQGSGAEKLCTVWQDPDFDASQPAFYYARVLENPSCRWSTRECNLLDTDQQSASCDDASVPKTVQHRAWSSPIWYQSASNN